MEKRFLTRPLEVRAAGNSRTVAGYAAVFNSQADIAEMFMEQIAPGAFSDTLADDVRALINHDTGRVIGRTKAGTLRLAQDATGLYCEIDLPDTADGRYLATLIERGDISGMSFGFEVTKQTWDETGDVPLRTIQAVDLYEVSAVAFPAYDDTSIAMRSLEASRKTAKRSNFNAAAHRLRMKAHLDLKTRS
jgi:HK97 family phage prohead protease